jgi:polar amino acid transport system substrate-binding protein
MVKLGFVRKATTVAALTALVIGGAAGCAKKDSGTTTDGVSLVHSGKLTTCTHLPYAPFQSKDPAGKVVGFDVRAIA